MVVYGKNVDEVRKYFFNRKEIVRKFSGHFFVARDIRRAYWYVTGHYEMNNISKLRNFGRLIFIKYEED